METITLLLLFLISSLSSINVVWLSPQSSSSPLLFLLIAWWHQRGRWICGCSNPISFWTFSHSTEKYKSNIYMLKGFITSQYYFELYTLPGSWLPCRSFSSLHGRFVHAQSCGPEIFALNYELIKNIFSLLKTFGWLKISTWFKIFSWLKLLMVNIV